MLTTRPLVRSQTSATDAQRWSGGVTRPGSTSYAATSKPARTRFAAIGPPMAPRPTNPTTLANATSIGRP